MRKSEFSISKLNNTRTFTIKLVGIRVVGKGSWKNEKLDSFKLEIPPRNWNVRSGVGNFGLKSGSSD